MFRLPIFYHYTQPKPYKSINQPQFHSFIGHDVPCTQKSYQNRTSSQKGREYISLVEKDENTLIPSSYFLEDTSMSILLLNLNIIEYDIGKSNPRFFEIFIDIFEYYKRYKCHQKEIPSHLIDDIKSSLKKLLLEIGKYDLLKKIDEIVNEND